MWFVAVLVCLPLARAAADPSPAAPPAPSHLSGAPAVMPPTAVLPADDGLLNRPARDLLVLAGLLCLLVAGVLLSRNAPSPAPPGRQRPRTRFRDDSRRF